MKAFTIFSLFHRAFPFTIFIFSNKCTFLNITPIYRVGHKSLTTLCKSQNTRNRWITTICDLIRPRGKSLGGGDLDGSHFVGGHIGFRSNILNGKGIM
jgi:hypothetical protein